MTLATVDANNGPAEGKQDFEKYFKNTDLFELFQYDASTSDNSCDTLELLLERDGFPIQETPTNNRHVTFLRDLDTLVKGITLNTCLYTNKESGQEERSEEILPKQVESDIEESKDASSDPYVKKRQISGRNPYGRSASESDFSSRQQPYRKKPYQTMHNYM